MRRHKNVTCAFGHLAANILLTLLENKNVQVDNDQEKAESEKKFPLQNLRWGKNQIDN